MSVNETKYDDEIDLLSLFETIWDGKWKIVFIVAVSLLLVLGFSIVKPKSTFTATTVIKPITSDEFDKYILFNLSVNNFEKEEKLKNIFEITPNFLLSLYVEEIEKGSLLETGIDKYNLINKDDFDSEDNYKDAIEKFVSEIEVLKPIKEKKEIRLHHILRAEYNNEDKWKDLLTFVDEEANKKVKANIISRFKTIVSVQQQKKNFAIKDMELKIDNIKKDYERITKNRLVFLTEQAAIARKLDIEKNTNDSQNLATQYTFNKNLKDEKIFMIDNPFYLRGYLAIEEEIKQINARKDKAAFIDDLYELEKQKRELEQDETIKRAEDLFNKTPINQNDFQATIVKVAATDYKTNNKTRLYYALAIVLGGMIGVVYVLIANAFRNRKNETVSL